MKRWAFVTVALYAAVLIILTAPVLIITLGNWWGHNHNGFSTSEGFEMYRIWQFWIWLGVLVLGQFLLLLVPVDVSQRRLVPRRKLLVPIITSAFLLANLVFAGIISVACAAFGDEAFYGLSVFGNGDAAVWSALIFIIGLFWTLWGFAFYQMTKKDEAPDAVARITRVLLKGSILELLVAIPSHVIVRQKDVCCAPAGSFWGIATGLSVMLLCYGPGVFFLFAERFARKQPKPPE